MLLNAETGAHYSSHLSPLYSKTTLQTSPKNELTILPGEIKQPSQLPESSWYHTRHGTSPATMNGCRTR
jgi:hypothetical protein